MVAGRFSRRAVPSAMTSSSDIFREFALAYVESHRYVTMPLGGLIGSHRQDARTEDLAVAILKVIALQSPIFGGHAPFIQAGGSIGERPG